MLVGYFAFDVGLLNFSFVEIVYNYHNYICVFDFINFNRNRNTIIPASNIFLQDSFK